MLQLLGQIDVKITKDVRSGMGAEVTIKKIKKGSEELAHIHACAALLVKTLGVTRSRRQEVIKEIIKQMKSMSNGTLEKEDYTPKFL